LGGIRTLTSLQPLSSPETKKLEAAETNRLYGSQAKNMINKASLGLRLQYDSPITAM